MAWKKPICYGNLPSRRAAHTFNMINGKLYLYGGTDGDRIYDSIHILDPSTMTWDTPQTTGDHPGARFNHASCVEGGVLYIHGGQSNGYWHSDLYMFEPEQLKWTRILSSGDVPEPRECHGMAKIGSFIYVFGGSNGTTTFGDMNVLNLDTGRWKTLNAVGPEPREHFAYTVWDDIILIYGGEGSKYYQDLWAFIPKTNQWEKLKIKGNFPRYVRGATISVNDNKLYVFGGRYQNQLSNQLKILDLNEMKWKSPVYQNQNFLEMPQPKRLHTGDISNNLLYIYGGYETVDATDGLFVIDVSNIEEADDMDTLAIPSIQSSLTTAARSPIHTPIGIQPMQQIQQIQMTKTFTKSQKGKKDKTAPRKSSQKKQRSSQSTGTKGKSRGVKEGLNLSLYIHRVLKQINPDVGISKKAMEVMNSMLNDILEQITDEIKQLMRVSKRKTLEVKVIRTALKLVLPGQLAIHAIAEGTKALAKYYS
mgnify:CR=1 FL=1